MITNLQEYIDLVVDDYQKEIIRPGGYTKIKSKHFG